MISSQRFNDYSNGLKRLSEIAGMDVEQQIQRLIKQHPDASVAEIRDMTIDLLTSLCGTYSEVASSVSATFYDTVADEAGAKLASAVIAPHDDPQSLEKTVRYKAGKLSDGDVDGFAHECGRFVSGNMKRSANETIMANAKRDKRRGVRFARVPTGAETCPFCYMLASRGAVYWSRESAGEFNHFHNDCDCRIVPSFDVDGSHGVVEGYDPDEMLKVMSKIEKETGYSFAHGEGSRQNSEALKKYFEKHK